MVGSSSKARLICLLLLCAPPASTQYLGAQSCRPCHAKQFAAHAASGHALALSRQAPAHASGVAPRADWAFGSGTHAVTWVSRLDDSHYLEHGRSWFRSTRTLGPTPGHDNPNGLKYRIFEPEAKILRCFSCHSTGLPRVDAANRIEPAEAGVNCEVCHGPGTAHVQSGGAKYRIENPARYRATAINDQCGACHRKPGAMGAAPKWEDPWNARHQPLYLAESRCFQESKEQLSCLTCHDPHAKLARDSKHYDAVCRNCHQAVRHKSVTAKASCVSCHMPTVRPSAQLGFANHWIGVYSPATTLRPRR